MYKYHFSLAMYVTIDQYLCSSGHMRIIDLGHDSDRPTQQLESTQQQHHMRTVEGIEYWCFLTYTLGAS